MKKVLAVASVGGHWVQLLRLIPAFKDTELVFMSTKEDFASMVSGYRFYAVPDSNRNNKAGLLKSFFKVFSVVRKERPDVVITTGAAPGLMALIAGKLINARTIWIDSIANVDEVSLSGRIALKFANRVYTQWPDLAKGKIFYAGNVLS